MSARPPRSSTRRRSCESASDGDTPATGCRRIRVRRSLVAGRLDSTVGYAAAADLVDAYPRASLAVVDDAGRACPHEQPDLLRALIGEWLVRVERSG